MLSMSNASTMTKSEILAIIDTYEGMLRLNWSAELLAQRTIWLARLAEVA